MFIYKYLISVRKRKGGSMNKKLFKRVISLFMTLIMIVSMIPMNVFAVIGGSTPENLCLNKTGLECMETAETKVHSVFTSSLAGEIGKIVDGDKDTYCWGSNSKYTHTYQIEVGTQASPEKVNFLRISLADSDLTENKILDKLEVLVTKDYQSWTTVATWDNINVSNDITLETKIDEQEVWVMWVRGWDAAETGTCMNLAEVEAYNDPNPQLTNLALGGDVLAMQPMSDNGYNLEPQPATVANVTDGSHDTFCYAGNGYYAHKYQIVLPNTNQNAGAKVNKIDLTFEADAVNGDSKLDEVVVKITNDYNTWKTVGTFEDVDVSTRNTISVDMDAPENVWVIWVEAEDTNTGMNFAELEAYYDKYAEEQVLLQKYKTPEGNVVLGADVRITAANDGVLTDPTAAGAVTKATDGNRLTFVYGANSAYAHTYLITLPEAKEMNTISVSYYIEAPHGEPSEWYVEIADESENWKEIGNFKNQNDNSRTGVVDKNDMSFDLQDVKFIKVVALDRNYLQNGMYLSEVEGYLDETLIPEAPQATVTLSGGSSKGVALDGWNVVKWCPDVLDTIKIDVAEKDGFETTVTVNGEPYVIGSDYKLTGEGTIEVVAISAKDGFRKAVQEFTLIVPEPTLIDANTNWAKGADAKLLDADLNVVGAKNGKVAANAVDGNEETTAVADVVANQVSTGAVGEPWTLEVDLGAKVANVNNIKVLFGQRSTWTDYPQYIDTHKTLVAPKQFKIEGSVDGEDWFTVYDHVAYSVQSAKFERDIVFKPVSVRYLRMTDTEPTIPSADTRAYQMEIAEFEVYVNDKQPAQGPAKINLALGATAVWKGAVENELICPGYPGNIVTYNPVNAVDGDFETVTMGAGEYNPDLYITLADTYQYVDQIDVYFTDSDAAVPNIYDVYVSDGSNWTKVGSVQGDESRHQTFTFEPQNVVGVKIIDNSADQTGPQISEVQVFSKTNGKPTNYAQNGTAKWTDYDGNTLSSPAGYGAENGVDYNEFTSTYATGSYKTVYEIELPERIESMNQIVIQFDKEGNRGVPDFYDVFSSEDGVNWTLIKEVTSEGDFAERDAEVVIDLFARPAKYIQIKDPSNTRSKNQIMSIADVIVYQGAKAETGTNHALGSNNLFYDISWMELPPSGIIPNFAKNATDGDYNTYAVAANTYQYQLYIDMKEIKQDVQEIRLFFGTPSTQASQCVPDRYRVQVSTDGQKWTTVYTVNEVLEPLEKEKEHFFTMNKQDIRYILITDLQSTTYDEKDNQIQMVIGEVEVYSTDRLDAAYPNLLTDNLTMRAEYGYQIFDGSTKAAIDGDTSTVIAPDYDGRWMLQGELAEVTKGINEVRVTFGARGFDDNAVPESFQIQASNDGNKWHAIAKSTSQEKDQTFVLTPQTFKYIRVVDTSKSMNHRMMISELQVMKTAAVFDVNTPLEVLDTYPKISGTFFDPEEEYLVYLNKPVTDLSYIRKYIYFDFFDTTQYNLDATGTVLKLYMSKGTFAYGTGYRTIISPDLDVPYIGDPIFLTIQEPRKDGAVDIARNATARFVDPNTGNDLPAKLGMEAEYCVDGDLTTVGVAARASLDDVYITEFDLGAEYPSVQEVRFTFGSTEIDADLFRLPQVKVTTSVDGETWDEGATWTDSIQKPNDYKVVMIPRRARYIRIETLNPTTAYNGKTTMLGISSLKVYEGDADPNVKLRVSEITPANGATFVKPDADVVVKFNRALTSSELELLNVTITKDSSTDAISAQISIDTTGAKLTINPDVDLEGNTKYIVSVNQDILLADGYDKGPFSFITEYIPTTPTVPNLAVGANEVLLKANVVNDYTEADMMLKPGGSTPHVGNISVDQNYDTSIVGAGFYQWQLQVDLGEVKEDVNEIRAYFVSTPTSDGVPQEYEILTSVDGYYWNPVLVQKSTSVANKEKIKQVNFDARPVRYVRIKDLLPVTRDANGIQIQMQVAELEVYATGEAIVADLDVSRSYLKDANTMTPSLYAMLTASADDANALDIKLVNKVTGEEVEVVKTLDATTGNTAITVTPAADLDYSTAYKFVLGEEVLYEFTSGIKPSTRPNLAVNVRNELLKPSVTDAYTAEDVLPASMGVYVAANATDGDPDTFAVPGGSYDWQLQIDLGEVKTNVNDIRIQFGSATSSDDATPLKFQVLGSTDGETWSVLRTIEYADVNSKAKIQKVSFAPTDLQYIRIKDMLEEEYNAQGQRIQMQIGEVTVHNVDETTPIDITSTPVDGANNVSVASNVVFEFNKLFADDYVVTFKRGFSNVEFNVTKDAQIGALIIDPAQYLETETEYTVTVSSETDGYSVSTTFTTNDVVPGIKIITQSSTAYSKDNTDAIYPVFVDGTKYQRFEAVHNGTDLTQINGKITDYFQFETVEADGAVTWEVISGNLPDGLELTSDGKLQGVATKEGTFNFSVHATDEGGNSAEKTLTIVANPYRAKWNTDAKFGVMVQWGPFSYPVVSQYPEQFEDRIYNFNAKEWINEIAAAGAKVFNFTVMGGDGVRLWPSTTPSYNELKIKRNIVQELIDECKKHDIKFIAYLPGHIAWSGMNDGHITDRTYTTLHKGLMLELIEMGVDGFWLDSGATYYYNDQYGYTWFNWNDIVPVLRAAKPDITFSGNYGASGVQGQWYKYCDIVTYEGFYNASTMIVAEPNYSQKKMGVEINQLMQSEWTWTPSVDASVHSTQDIIANIKANWDNGVTYLAAVAADASGNLMSPICREQIEPAFDWVADNVNKYPFGQGDRLTDDAAVVTKDQEIFTGIKVEEGESPIASIGQGSYDLLSTMAGQRIITGNTPVTLTHLGRYKAEGNSQVHEMHLTKLDKVYSPLRVVDIDMSQEAEADGFVYVELEYPVVLEPNTQYFIMARENTTDTFARPNTEALYNEFGVTIADGTWTNSSSTFWYSNHGEPGEGVSITPQEEFAEARGGGLVNFKAAVSEGSKAASLSQGKFGWFTTTTGRPIGPSRTNFTASYAMYALDGNEATSAAAGDDAWASRYYIDFGEVKENVNSVTVNFDTYFPLTLYVYGSEDGKNYELLKHTLNDVGSSFSTTFEPTDLRSMYIETTTIDGANIGVGKFAIWKEIYVGTENIATNADVSIVYKQTNTPKKIKDNISYANFAIDNDKHTTAAALTDNTSLKVNLNGCYAIDEINVVSDNTALTYYSSMDGKSWEPVDMTYVTDVNGDSKSLLFDVTPLKTKCLLISPTDSNEPITLSDLQIYGETYVDQTPGDVITPAPDQPAVGGGGGGSSSGDSSSGSTSGDSAGTVAPDVKHGWAKTSDGKWTYGNEDGKATIGWANIHGLWYYFDADGIMQTGWMKDTDGKWYYLTSDGSMATGWVHDGNAWYYMNSSGAMKTGWVMVDSKWYYLDNSGAMVIGWRQVGASWYYMAPNGAMLTGWQLIGGKWYYMHSTGSMAFNQWIYSNGKWYYVTSDGSMAVNTVIDGYKVDENGVWVG